MAKRHNIDRLDGEFRHKDGGLKHTISTVLDGKLDKNGSPFQEERVQLEVSQADAFDELRLHKEEDLQTTSMVCTLSALVIAMTSSEHRSKKVLDELATKYAAEFSTPQWAIPHIKSLIQRRMKELPTSVPVRKTSTKPYLIWENNTPLREGTETDINQLREAALKGNFDIFAKDAEGGELLVFGKPSSLQVGETDAWKTLTALLERIGSIWTKEDLFGRVRPDIEYKRDIHSGPAYQWVRYVKDILEDDIAKVHRNSLPDLVDTWFFTKHPNRVEISSKLRACLIRKNPSINIR
jgi:hypothetical protein